MQWTDCNSHGESSLTVLIEWLRGSYPLWRIQTPKSSLLGRPTRRLAELCTEFKNLLAARGLPDRSGQSIRSKICHMERGMKMAWVAMEAKGILKLDDCDQDFRLNILWCCPQFMALAPIMTADTLQIRSKRQTDLHAEPTDRPKRHCSIKSDPFLETPTAESATASGILPSTAPENSGTDANDQDGEDDGTKSHEDADNSNGEGAGVVQEAGLAPSGANEEELLGANVSASNSSCRNEEQEDAPEQGAETLGWTEAEANAVERPNETGSNDHSAGFIQQPTEDESVVQAADDATDHTQDDDIVLTQATAQAGTEDQEMHLIESPSDTEVSLVKEGHNITDLCGSDSIVTSIAIHGEPHQERDAIAPNDNDCDEGVIFLGTRCPPNHAAPDPQQSFGSEFKYLGMGPIKTESTNFKAESDEHVASLWRQDQTEAARKQEAFSLQVQALREKFHVQSVLERALARREMLKAGIPLEEVDQLLPQNPCTDSVGV